MLLRVQSAVAGVRANGIRPRAASDSASKASQLFVPADALSVGSEVVDITEDAESRPWTWSPLWGTSKKDVGGEYRGLDRRDTLGGTGRPEVHLPLATFFPAACRSPRKKSRLLSLSAMGELETFHQTDTEAFGGRLHGDVQLRNIRAGKGWG